MPSLLTSEAFPDPWIDARAAGASFVAEARFEGAIVGTHWLRDDVTRLLPPGVSLGRNAAAESDVHPVVFVFGVQSAATFVVGGLAIPSTVSFAELMIAVPFVRRGRDPHLHVFFPRVYSADAFSTWSARTNYGIEKELADMRWFGRTFTVTSRDGPLLLHAMTESVGEWHGFDRVAGLQAMTEVFRRPALGRRRDGADVRSYFEWRTHEATARAARAVVTIDTSLGAVLGPCVVHGVGGETFAVRDMRWRISWPTGCDH